MPKARFAEAKSSRSTNFGAGNSTRGASVAKTGVSATTFVSVG